MPLIAKNKNLERIGTLEVMGKKFVVMSKEHFDELLILFKSVIDGEKLLKRKKTRSFDEFLKSMSKK
ncbi:MAG: hypothetical protein KatS3mg096_361 [Candidatus Parcubacteria bacterium]|nr:MAG: hypothetical protein KatS3mg096_361 [Candidatus Parcubacteria bacterium]